MAASPTSQTTMAAIVIVLLRKSFFSVSCHTFINLTETVGLSKVDTLSNSGGHGKSMSFTFCVKGKKEDKQPMRPRYKRQKQTHKLKSNDYFTTRNITQFNPNRKAQKTYQCPGNLSLLQQKNEEKQAEGERFNLLNIPLIIFLNGQTRMEGGWTVDGRIELSK